MPDVRHFTCIIDLVPKLIEIKIRIILQHFQIAAEIFGTVQIRNQFSNQLLGTEYFL